MPRMSRAPKYGTWGRDVPEAKLDFIRAGDYNLDPLHPDPVRIIVDVYTTGTGANQRVGITYGTVPAGPGQLIGFANVVQEQSSPALIVFDEGDPSTPGTAWESDLTLWLSVRVKRKHDGSIESISIVTPGGNPD